MYVVLPFASLIQFSNSISTSQASSLRELLRRPEPVLLSESPMWMERHEGDLNRPQWSPVQ